MDGVATYSPGSVRPPDGSTLNAMGDAWRQTRAAAERLAGMVEPGVGRMLELCAGYGGFSLALSGIAQTVCYVERDAYAAATIASRITERRLPDAPIWDDVDTFDGTAWKGLIDIVVGGIPCQPFSAAGKRLGTDDDRWLWPDIARIIRDVEPRYVFLENVPGVVRAGLAHVLGDLAQLGFDAEWGLYAASDVGAPHRRQRFWLVGDARGAGRSEVTRGTHGDEGPHGPQHGHVTDGAGEDVGNPSSVRCGTGLGPDPQERQGWLTDTQVASHRFPPRPDDIDGWEQWDGPQPGIRRGADGSTEWLADALHLGGNGLVPQCAREAWLQLTARLEQ